MTNRIRRLEDEGVIEGYRVALNPTRLGWSMTIMAGLRIQKGRMIDVQQKISADLACSPFTMLQVIGIPSSSHAPKIEPTSTT